MTMAPMNTLPPPRLALADLSFSYDETPVLHDVTCTVEPGEFLGIVGPNGAGKTTVLRLLSGVASPAVGSATADGQAIDRLDARQRARMIAVVPQSESVTFPWPVYSMIMLGRHPHTRSFGFEQEEDHRAVTAAMQQVGIEHLSRRSVTDLSSGELHRVLIARALAQNTPVILLDEPNAHLDIHHQVELFELLSDLHDSEGRSIVIITHDLNLASMYCDRLLLMDQGRIASLGTPAEVLRSETIHRHFGVAVHIETSVRPFVRLLRPLKKPDA
jgi:iron complex transport system ATP-binding protein